MCSMDLQNLIILLLTFIALSLSQELPKNILGTTDAPDREAERYRLLVYQKNLNVINRHNQNSTKTYELGVNSFAILDDKQIKANVLTLFPSDAKTIQFAKKHPPQPEIRSYALSVDQEDQFDEERLLEEYYRSGKVSQAPPLPNNPSQKSSVHRIQSPPAPEFDLQSYVLSRAKIQLQIRDIPEEEVDEIISNYTQEEPSPSERKGFNRRRLQVFEVQKNNLRRDMSVDWTCVAGDVRSQGRCGACYAFAPADGVSAVLAIYYYTFFVSLSYQEILSCSRNLMTFGCAGGFLEGSFSYMASEGILTSHDYGYNSEGGVVKEPCKLKDKSNKMKSFIRDFQYIESQSCDDIKTQLQRQPIVVGVTGFQLLFYTKGVLSDCSSFDRLDHAVLIIGFKEGVGWKIKNSWGKQWGINGYGWIADGNTCRICELAFYPILNDEKGGSQFAANRKLKQCPNE